MIARPEDVEIAMARPLNAHPQHARTLITAPEYTGEDLLYAEDAQLMFSEE